MEKLKILKMIAESNSLILKSNEYRELKKFYSETVAKNKEDVEIKSNIGEEKYTKLVKIATDLNTKIEAFRWMSSQGLMDVNELANSIFNNFVMLFNGENILKLFKTFENTTELDYIFNIAGLINNLSDYCIEQNYDARYINTTLKNGFETNEQVIKAFETLINQNRMQLQLNYICHNLKSKGH